MDISIIVNKTLIIPETSPMLLKPENLEMDCRWQYIKQQGELLQAEGMADFRLAYLTLSPEAFDDCAYEEILQLLDEAACNPQPQLRHCLTISSPLEICENIDIEHEIIGLQLFALSYEIISPRALELQMQFGVELKERQLPPTKEEMKMEIKEEIRAEICEEKCEEKAFPEPCARKEEFEESCLCEEPEAETKPVPCGEENPQEPSPQLCKEEKELKEKQSEEKEAEQNADGKPICRPRFSAARQNSFRNSAQEGQERPKSSYSMKFYRVREGDSLWTIAEKMQVPAAEISRLNKLEDGEIRPGMLLSIPRI